MDSHTHSVPVKEKPETEAEQEGADIESSDDSSLDGDSAGVPAPAPPHFEDERFGEGGEMESSKRLTFYPPVGTQRYLKVRQVLEDLIASKDGERAKSILEVGCASFNMHLYLKNVKTVEKIIYLDLDRGTMRDASRKLQPLAAEYLIKRSTRLAVEAYAGDVTVLDGVLVRADPPIFAIIAIEVVEHLMPEVLVGFERTVFGLLQPPVILLTTPNSEFNVVFDLEPGQFRHWDHKFEWTREEFRVWCEKMCKTYPQYSVEICGIGKGDAGTEQYGSVSQLAIFTRSTDDLDCPTKELPADSFKENAYELVYSVEYPFYVDTRSRAERILDQFEYYVNTFILTSSNVYEYLAEGLSEYELSLSRIQEFHGMPDNTTKEEILEVVRSAGKTIRVKEEEGEHVVVLAVKDPQDSDSDSQHDSPLEEEDVAGACGQGQGVGLGGNLNLSEEEEEEEW